MNIYVGNLHFKVNEESLGKVFNDYGKVSSVKIITDKYSGRSKGYGFIIMDNDKEALKAIKELNGTSVENRQIIVNEAKPRKTDY